MQAALERATRVAASPSTSVRLQGESGTGKEVIARFIHDNTPGRRDEAFVEFNCAAVAEGLLESELFGHERGAFTDAKISKRGLFEVASGGTLFLDEIGEMRTDVQVKLLRALETTRFRRVGGTRDLQADVRIIAATNRDLEAEVRAGRFRYDLFYRLDVFNLTLPPLRERREDILPLANFLLERISQRLARTAPQLTPDAERVLLNYDYPGNVRELRNVLERALILESGSVLGPSSLVLGTLGTAPEGRPLSSVLGTPGTAPEARPQSSVEPAFFSIQLDHENRPPSLAEVEGLYVARILKLTGWNRTQAARLLDVSYPTVSKKIADFGLKETT